MRDKYQIEIYVHENEQVYRRGTTWMCTKLYNDSVLFVLDRNQHHPFNKRMLALWASKETNCDVI